MYRSLRGNSRDWSQGNLYRSTLEEADAVSEAASCSCEAQRRILFSRIVEVYTKHEGCLTSSNFAWHLLIACFLQRFSTYMGSLWASVQLLEPLLDHDITQHFVNEMVQKLYKSDTSHHSCVYEVTNQLSGLCQLSAILGLGARVPTPKPCT